MVPRRLPRVSFVALVFLELVLFFSASSDAAAVLGLATRRPVSAAQPLRLETNDRWTTGFGFPVGASKRRLLLQHRRPRRRRRIRDAPLTLMASTAVDADETLGDLLTTTPDARAKVPYESLSPIARLIAGAVEGVVTVAIEYMSGFPLAYIAGAVVGLPAVVRRGGAWGAMHGKAMRWGHSMGTLNAVFGGSAVLVKTIRPNSRNQHGAYDPWNHIMSSMLAGAYFARKEGPQAMVRSAVLYGGLLYLVSGRERKKDPSGYEDQVLGL